MALAVHESEEKLEKPLNEEQQDLLIKCITQDLGFSGGKPVAACVIYKCLLHWRSFEVERTSVFERIIQTIASSIEDADNNDVLAYWLCNTSTLLMLLLDALRQVEAKHPALLFEQLLTAYLEKIYGMIRGNLEKEVSPLIWQCLKARLSDAARQAARIAPWQSIVEILDKYLNTMKANYVPAFLVRKVFAQTLSFMNVQLFNLLLKLPCQLSNVEYAKSGLAELEQWCCLATEDYVDSAWDELKHIRQAVGFLLQVIHEEPEMTLVDVYYELCPELSIIQIYRISKMFWDDKDGTHSVPPHLISSMRDVLTEGYPTNDPFLLDDDLSIPFSVDDLSKSMPTVEAADVEPPPLIRENSGFMFLHQRSDS